MKESVYIETSIFSFYYDERPGHSVIAMRDWTREWWNEHAGDYLLTTSTAVFDELRRGNKSHRQDALALALTLPAIRPTKEIEEIMQVYFKHRLMPRDPLGDALHLALASYHKLDYLLTWNCQNLANANKFTHMRRIHALLGLHVPILTTPLELMGETS
uniref:PIN domain-containing protein n=1 Tax=Candidatus Kentrum sp. SD TaxID=2126332 RepID=A0A451BML8_9GAMM|nr:MAG: PIN domain-containing protein [Candidatus Kentron sp. SD]